MRMDSSSWDLRNQDLQIVKIAILANVKTRSKLFANKIWGLVLANASLKINTKQK